MAEEKIKVNLEWLRNNFPCMMACPVHTEAGRYVHLIAEKRYAEAYRIARAPNPFASICGRICAAPCEDACRRGKLDQPISIRALKRFVTERYGVESLIDVTKLHDVMTARIKSKKKWVAVVGSGPAGLSCAHDLALLGYQVTVFEKYHTPGGMLRLGIPEYRLPRELIRLEINAILSLGVELKLGKEIGRDFTIGDLFENGYQAVFLAMGAHKSRQLNIDGVTADGVLNAIDYLLNINLGYRVNLGEKIVVIGGGNVAFDVARSAVRHEKPQSIASSDITSALDVARSAVRFGAKKLDMVILEPRDQMLADEEEIEQALEERINIYNSIGPKRILVKNGKVTGLEAWSVASLFDEAGRFNPRFLAGTERVFQADTIIIAIGQSADFSFIQPKENIQLTARGTIQVDSHSLMTTMEGVFAGGDIAYGPRNVISAIADGRRAARGIDTYLSSPPERSPQISITRYHTSSYLPSPGYTKIPRQPIPMLPLDRRVGIAQVELGYSEEQAVQEARRCLRCWENTIFEGNSELGTECILCAGCVDICPENCIELFPQRRIRFTEQIEQIVSEQFCDYSSAREPSAMVIIKNDEVCIRCGLCARRCPVGTITMQGFEEMTMVS